MEQHKVDVWEAGDDGLQIGRVGQDQADIRVPQPGVQLQRLGDGSRALCSAQDLERAQDEPVVERLILDATGAPRLTGSARKRLENSVVLGLLHVQPGPVADDRLVADDVGVCDRRHDHFLEALLEQVEAG